MTSKLVTTLKNDIINGHLKAGDKLLPLRELALAHKVSRSVVNAAVGTLAAQGTCVSCRATTSSSPIF
ncbi:MAG: GntR family transcriptional regulator [Candidatus Moduliflexus flocculans]|nr:GntR family transcriptional regulator [Candidatus Moduliflexus flocculans]